MEKVYATTKYEYNNVIKLINKIFRTNKGFSPTMLLEFPQLLGITNIDNIRIIQKDTVPVSVASFLKQDILIEGASIKVASIGGVCTDPLWRGNNYSSLILDDIEAKMYDDGVELLLVSGTRSLYQRRGCTMTKNFLEYTIYPENIETNFEIKEYKYEDIYTMISLYNTLPIKFYRSHEDFITLMTSSTIPFGYTTYQKYIILKDKVISGYIILKITNNIKNVGHVKECFGEYEDIFEALKLLGYINNLENISYRINKNDLVDYIEKPSLPPLISNINKPSELTAYSNISVKEAYQEGSLKVINFEKLMTSLLPYFTNHVDDAIITEIKFQVCTYELTNNSTIKNSINLNSNLSNLDSNDTINDDTISDPNQGFKLDVGEDILNHIDVIDSCKIYKFILNKEIIEIDNLRTLNKLIFEGSKGLNINFTGNENLKSFIDKVFPIPFVYLGNLNYQ